MRSLLETRDRLVDRGGHPLEWRGKWLFVERTDPVASYWLSTKPEMPAFYPREYYQEGLRP